VGDTQFPPDIGADYIPRRRQDLFDVEIEGEIIIYDERLETAHLLNPSAAVVWHLLDGQSRLGDVALDLAEVFDRDTDEILSDVIHLVHDFAGQDLLDAPAADTAAVD
jgi:hypothetical protein